MSDSDFRKGGITTLKDLALANQIYEQTNYSGSNPQSSGIPADTDVADNISRDLIAKINVKSGRTDRVEKESMEILIRDLFSYGTGIIPEIPRSIKLEDYQTQQIETKVTLKGRFIQGSIQTRLFAFDHEEKTILSETKSDTFGRFEFPEITTNVPFIIIKVSSEIKLIDKVFNEEINMNFVAIVDMHSFTSQNIYMSSLSTMIYYQYKALIDVERARLRRENKDPTKMEIQAITDSAFKNAKDQVSGLLQLPSDTSKLFRTTSKSNRLSTEAQDGEVRLNYKLLSSQYIFICVDLLYTVLKTMFSSLTYQDICLQIFNFVNVEKISGKTVSFQSQTTLRTFLSRKYGFYYRLKPILNTLADLIYYTQKYIKDKKLSFIGSRRLYISVKRNLNVFLDPVLLSDTPSSSNPIASPSGTESMISIFDKQPRPQILADLSNLDAEIIVSDAFDTIAQVEKKQYDSDHFEELTLRNNKPETFHTIEIKRQNVDLSMTNTSTNLNNFPLVNNYKLFDFSDNQIKFKSVRVSYTTTQQPSLQFEPMTRQSQDIDSSTFKGFFTGNIHASTNLFKNACFFIEVGVAGYECAHQGPTLTPLITLFAKDDIYDQEFWVKNPYFYASNAAGYAQANLLSARLNTTLASWSLPNIEEFQGSAGIQFLDDSKLFLSLLTPARNEIFEVPVLLFRYKYSWLHESRAYILTHQKPNVIIDPLSYSDFLVHEQRLNENIQIESSRIHSVPIMNTETNLFEPASLTATIKPNNFEECRVQIIFDSFRTGAINSFVPILRIFGTPNNWDGLYINNTNTTYSYLNIHNFADDTGFLRPYSHSSMKEYLFIGLFTDDIGDKYLVIVQFEDEDPEGYPSGTYKVVHLQNLTLVQLDLDPLNLDIENIFINNSMAQSTPIEDLYEKIIDTSEDSLSTLFLERLTYDIRNNAQSRENLKSSTKNPNDLTIRLLGLPGLALKSTKFYMSTSMSYEPLPIPAPSSTSSTSDINSAPHTSDTSLPTVVEIYVSAGSTSTPYYAFYRDSGGNEVFDVSSEALNSSYIYRFRRLNEASSHDFFISTEGSSQPYDADKIEVRVFDANGYEMTDMYAMGNMGIWSDRYFELKFKEGFDPSVDTLHWYCTIHSYMTGTFLVEEVQVIRPLPSSVIVSPNSSTEEAVGVEYSSFLVPAESSNRSSIRHLPEDIKGFRVVYNEGSFDITTASGKALEFLPSFQIPSVNSTLSQSPETFGCFNETTSATMSSQFSINDDLKAGQILSAGFVRGLQLNYIKYGNVYNETFEKQFHAPPPDESMNSDGISYDRDVDETESTPLPMPLTPASPSNVNTGSYSSSRHSPVSSFQYSIRYDYSLLNSGISDDVNGAIKVRVDDVEPGKEYSLRSNTKEGMQQVYEERFKINDDDLVLHHHERDVLTFIIPVSEFSGTNNMQITSISLMGKKSLGSEYKWIELLNYDIHIEQRSCTFSLETTNENIEYFGLRILMTKPLLSNNTSEFIFHIGKREKLKSEYIISLNDLATTDYTLHKVNENYDSGEPYYEIPQHAYIEMNDIPMTLKDDTKLRPLHLDLSFRNCNISQYRCQPLCRIIDTPLWENTKQDMSKLTFNAIDNLTADTSSGSQIVVALAGEHEDFIHLLGNNMEVYFSVDHEKLNLSESTELRSDGILYEPYLVRFKNTRTAYNTVRWLSTQVCDDKTDAVPVKRSTMRIHQYDGIDDYVHEVKIGFLGLTADHITALTTDDKYSENLTDFGMDEAFLQFHRDDFFIAFIEKKQEDSEIQDWKNKKNNIGERFDTGLYFKNYILEKIFFEVDDNKNKYYVEDFAIPLEISSYVIIMAFGPSNGNDYNMTYEGTSTPVTRHEGNEFSMFALPGFSSQQCSTRLFIEYDGYQFHVSVSTNQLNLSTTETGNLIKLQPVLRDHTFRYANYAYTYTNNSGVDFEPSRFQCNSILGLGSSSTFFQSPSQSLVLENTDYSIDRHILSCRLTFLAEIASSNPDNFLISNQLLPKRFNQDMVRLNDTVSGKVFRISEGGIKFKSSENQKSYGELVNQELYGDSHHLFGRNESFNVTFKNNFRIMLNNESIDDLQIAIRINFFSLSNVSDYMLNRLGIQLFDKDRREIPINPSDLPWMKTSKRLKYPWNQDIDDTKTGGNIFPPNMNTVQSAFPQIVYLQKEAKYIRFSFASNHGNRSFQGWDIDVFAVYDSNDSNDSNNTKYNVDGSLNESVNKSISDIGIVMKSVYLNPELQLNTEEQTIYEEEAELHTDYFLTYKENYKIEENNSRNIQKFFSDDKMTNPGYGEIRFSIYPKQNMYRGKTYIFKLQKGYTFKIEIHKLKNVCNKKYDLIINENNNQSKVKINNEFIIEYFDKSLNQWINIYNLNKSRYLGQIFQTFEGTTSLSSSTKIIDSTITSSDMTSISINSDIRITIKSYVPDEMEFKLKISIVGII